MAGIDKYATKESLYPVKRYHTVHEWKKTKKTAFKNQKRRTPYVIAQGDRRKYIKVI